MAYSPLQNAVKCLHLKPLELSHLEREREASLQEKREGNPVASLCFSGAAGSCGVGIAFGGCEICQPFPAMSELLLFNYRSFGTVMQPS